SRPSRASARQRPDSLTYLMLGVACLWLCTGMSSNAPPCHRHATLLPSPAAVTALTSDSLPAEGRAGVGWALRATTPNSQRSPMFDRLTDSFNGLFRKLSGQSNISEKNVADAMADVRTALLEADVHLDVVNTFCDQVLQESVGREVTKS